jgi:hypothetical protein
MSDRQRRDDATTRADVFMSYLATRAPSAAVMREAQQADTECRSLYRFLTTGMVGYSAVDSQSLKDTAYLLREAARAEVHDRLLYQRVPPTLTDR